MGKGKGSGAEARGGEAEPSRPVQDVYASLREELGSLMDDLRRRVADARAMPPLSTPQGRGKAYAKFLAIYTATLDGAGEASAAADPADALDARA